MIILWERKAKEKKLYLKHLIKDKKLPLEQQPLLPLQQLLVEFISFWNYNKRLNLFLFVV